MYHIINLMIKNTLLTYSIKLVLFIGEPKENIKRWPTIMKHIDINFSP